MSRININQKNILLDFMKTYYVQIYGKFSKNNGREFKDKLWNDLMTHLNETGPQKSVEQWKRVS